MPASGIRISLIYKYVIIVSGLALLFFSVNSGTIPELPELLPLVILATIAESQSVSVGKDKSISVGFALDLCTLLLYGPAAAAVVVFISVLASVNRVEGRGYIHVFNIPWHATLFNCTNLTISVFISGKIYEFLGGRFLMSDAHAGISSINEALALLRPHFFSLIVVIFVHIILNTGIIAIYIGLEAKSKVLQQWLYNFRWSIINLFIVGIIGVTITLVYKVFGNIGILLFMAPLLLARYTFVQYIKMREVYLNTIKALTAAIEAKDKYTMGHSQRVEEYSLLIAKEIRLTPDRMDTLRFAALLHDIGKIGITEIVLNKPGNLSEEEYGVIKQHPEIGCKILEDVGFLKNAVSIIRAHHERYDGRGYPAGLKGDEIPIEASIMSVADAFDAMTSDRPYRKAKKIEDAIQEIKKMSGIQFSPKVVEAFLKVIGEVKEEVDV